MNVASQGVGGAPGASPDLRQIQAAGKVVEHRTGLTNVITV